MEENIKSKRILSLLEIIGNIKKDGNIYLAEFDEYYKILDCEVGEYYKKLSSLE